MERRNVNGYHQLVQRFVSLIYSKNDDGLDNQAISESLELTRSHVDYWISKRNDLTFHPLIWGKHTNRKRVFSEIEIHEVFQAFLRHVKDNPIRCV